MLSVRLRAEATNYSWYTLPVMAKTKLPPTAPDETLDKLLDKVSDAREALVSIERTLERLRSDISALDKRKKETSKTR